MKTQILLSAAIIGLMSGPTWAGCAEELAKLEFGDHSRDWSEHRSVGHGTNKTSAAGALGRQVRQAGNGH